MRIPAAPAVALYTFLAGCMVLPLAKGGFITSSSNQFIVHSLLSQSADSKEQSTRRNLVALREQLPEKRNRGSSSGNSVANAFFAQSKHKKAEDKKSPNMAGNGAQMRRLHRTNVQDVPHLFYSEFTGQDLPEEASDWMPPFKKSKEEKTAVSPSQFDWRTQFEVVKAKNLKKANRESPLPEEKLLQEAEERIKLAIKEARAKVKEASEQGLQRSEELAKSAKGIATNVMVSVNELGPSVLL